MILVLGLGLNLEKLFELISHNDMVFKCLVLWNMFEFGNGHIRPPVPALLFDVVLDLERVTLTLTTKYVSLALTLKVVALPWTQLSRPMALAMSCREGYSLGLGIEG